MIRQRHPIARRTPLKRSTKPLKRSAIKKVSKRTRVLKSGRLILDAAGMSSLRMDAYERSGGVCECGLVKKRKACGKFVHWNYGELHHIKYRSRGGSDTIENVAFIRPECHEYIHKKGL